MAMIAVVDRLTGRKDLHIDADLFGVFAVHPTVEGSPDAYTLTHIPTGMAYLSGVTKAAAEACAHEINAGNIDWSGIRQQSDLTKAHHEQGRDMRQRYQRW